MDVVYQICIRWAFPGQITSPLRPLQHVSPHLPLPISFTHTVPKGFYTSTTLDNVQTGESPSTAYFPSIAITAILCPFQLILATSTPSVLFNVIVFFTRPHPQVEFTTGDVVVSSLRSAIVRHGQISAPHPKFDPGTVEEAVATFDLTGSNSLLVTGRHHNTFLHDSVCVPIA